MTPETTGMVTGQLVDTVEAAKTRYELISDEEHAVRIEINRKRRHLSRVSRSRKAAYNEWQAMLKPNDH